VYGRIVVLFTIGSLATPFAHARPDQVIIIRHAEKPQHGHDLTVKGRERAAALAPFFLDCDKAAPVAIYAQGPNDDHPSRRSVETVTPLAHEMKLDVKTCHRGENAEMVKEILSKPEYEGKVVLICWSHKEIPGLATALGVVDPPDWQDGAFDRVWVIKLKDGKAALQDLPQRLLYGDAAQ
jgi:hypothetical protein